MFTTVKVNVRLVDSQGQGLEGGNMIYCRSSWGDYGNTDVNGNSYREMLPGTYSFRMKYELGQQDKKQDIVDNPEVIFSTVPLTVVCKNEEGDPAAGVRVRYSRSNWGEMGVADVNGNVEKELLPSKYTVRAYLGDGYEDKKIDFTEASTVVFITEAVAETYSLDVRVNPVGAGNVIKSPDLSTYESGTVVTLTQTHVEGYTFDRFESSDGIVLTSNEIVMDANKVVVAYYTLDEIPEELTLTTSVVPVEGGTVEVTPLKGTYSYGDMVTIKASPNAGYTFESYKEYGTDAEIQVQMIDHVNIQAIFKELGASDTIIVTNIDELNQAEVTARNGNVTILVDDGTYILSDQFMIRGNHVTLRSLNGNAENVIIRGNGMTGTVPHVFSVYADHFTLEDVTIGWVRNMVFRFMLN